MNPQVRTKPDDTRARIIGTAEALFRRLGFAKTTVADIAAELGMSPANVYRFFASKDAIVEAICKRCLSDVEEKAWTVARSKASAAARMERLILEILAYHKENFVSERRRYRHLGGAAAGSWGPTRGPNQAIGNCGGAVLAAGTPPGRAQPARPPRNA